MGCFQEVGVVDLEMGVVGQGVRMVQQRVFMVDQKVGVVGLGVRMVEQEVGVVCTPLEEAMSRYLAKGFQTSATFSLVWIPHRPYLRNQPCHK